MDFDWKALVRTVAPGIASVFGTPLAGLGVSALLKVLLPEGAEQPANPDAFLAQALQAANPEMLLKIKQADQAFALEIKRLDIDLERLGGIDRASARQMQVATLSPVPAILTVLIVGGFFGVMILAIYRGMPSTSAPGGEAILMLLGSLTTGFASVIAYWLGKTQNDNSKDAMLANSIPVQALEKVR